jgi:methylisocitrate lyase
VAEPPVRGGVDRHVREKPTMSLRALIARPLPVTAPLVLNPLMAKLVERAGFPAGYLGGGATGYQKVSLEANLNVTEMCQAALDIRAVSPLPLILDGACGYGDPMHMHRTIGMSEAAGFAAIEIEDQLVPKRAHHHVGIEHMIPLELMAAKIREAAAARRSPEFLIIGRTNAMRASDMDDALRRGEAYRKAGADLVLLSMAHRPEDLRAIGERLGPPLMYLAGRGGLAGAGITLEELGRLGFRIVADPSTPLLAAYAAWKKVYQELADGFGARITSKPDWSPVEQDMLAVIDIEKLLAIERATVETGEPHPRSPSAAHAG